MKALSIRQPWAWLIVNGYKDIENREWKTNFRGRFLVHAGWIFDQAGYEKIQSATEIRIPEPDEFDRGGIVEAVDIIDCVTESDSPWFEGKYGFVLKNPAVLPFVQLRGQKGFFDVKDDFLQDSSNSTL